MASDRYLKLSPIDLIDLINLNNHLIYYQQSYFPIIAPATPIHVIHHTTPTVTLH